MKKILLELKKKYDQKIQEHYNEIAKKDIKIAELEGRILILENDSDFEDKWKIVVFDKLQEISKIKEETKRDVIETVLNYKVRACF